MRCFLLPILYVSFLYSVIYVMSPMHLLSLYCRHYYLVLNMSMDTLGMESYTITDRQITYSSGNVISPGPRLNTDGQWSAGSQDLNQWLQISLFRQTNITGVVLMGNPGSNYYVSSYRVEVCLDGASWENVTDEIGDTEVLSSQITFFSRPSK